MSYLTKYLVTGTDAGEGAVKFYSIYLGVG